jgi:hypothetical protein
MNTDFVDFNLAKKLKEKGYPQRTFGKYTMLYACYIEDGRFYENGCIAEVATSCTAPTISQVLKWLREEKKIHICIDLYDDGWFFDILSFYKADVGVYEIEIPFYSSNAPDHESYELAALAGFEYVLNELI